MGYGTFVVSALKYRPQQFKDVVGQSAITETLRNAILKNQLPQALLFCGPTWGWKTTCARILAKQINSTDHENIDPDQDFAFNIFELDAASNNSVDDIRSSTIKYGFHHKQERTKCISLMRYICSLLQPSMRF